MKKKILVSLLVVLLLLVSYYCAMLISTNGLIDYVQGVMQGDISGSEVEDSPLRIYSYFASRDDFEYADVKVSRVFVIHNFTDGYMWVDYSIKAYNENGEVIAGSATTFPTGLSKWKIHRENGEWKVVDIVESP